MDTNVDLTQISAGSIQHGEELYSKNCKICHGAEGDLGLGGASNLKTSTLVIDFPNYFTPNGDNYNDYWNIYAIQNQPSAKIYIFDRYVKLITQLNPLGQGWDGNYNGNPLPATDYWFVLEYIEKDSSGSNVWRTFKSHFSLLR